MHQSHQKRRTQEAQLNCKLDVSWCDVSTATYSDGYMFVKFREGIHIVIGTLHSLMHSNAMYGMQWTLRRRACPKPWLLRCEVAIGCVLNVCWERSWNPNCLWIPCPSTQCLGLVVLVVLVVLACLYNLDLMVRAQWNWHVIACLAPKVIHACAKTGDMAGARKWLRHMRCSSSKRISA